MKKLAFAIGAVALALTAFPVPSYAQNCEILRLACLKKDQLGEKGQGNCKRYRNSCQSAPFVPASGQSGGQSGSFKKCKVLRVACLFKEPLGLTGLGTCQRYRETCQ